jgi:hypothetical protein
MRSQQLAGSLFFLLKKKAWCTMGGGHVPTTSERPAAARRCKQTFWVLGSSILFAQTQESTDFFC